MMNYFEVKERLGFLLKFRDMYAEYIGFTNREANVPAQMTRQKMEPLAPMTVESLTKVGLGGLVTRDAPVRGGRKIRVNLIKAIFRDKVIKRFDLKDKEPLKLLDQGILEYRKRLWQQQLQLFNPIFWLYQMGQFLARLPILVFRRAGFDTRQAESLGAVKFYLVSFQILYFYLVADVVGVTDWLQIHVIALLFPF